MRASIIFFAAVLILAAYPSIADTNQTSSCLDGAGGWSSNGVLRNVSAVAQPGGVSVSKNGTMVNYAGFINTFSLKPDQDTDGDGLADEVDADNDGDGLQDEIELAGTSFSPGTPTDINEWDTDGDGVSDSGEAGAGTNPQDADQYLRIVSIEDTAGGTEVKWTARDGKSYYVLGDDDSYTQIPPMQLDTNTASGGVAPWWVTTNTYVDTAGSDTRFYAIEVAP